MVILLYILTFFYLGLLLWLSFGLRHLKATPAGDKISDQVLPTVSLIVCARNEAQRLPRLLPRLAQQNYPADKLEICLVDDRSTDRTGALIAEFAITQPNVIHLRIADTLPDFAPKKRAIDAAIRQTTGDIILLTDADAEPGPAWCREMVRAFKPETVMVCGYSPYSPRATFWQKVLALEYFSHAAVAAGGSGHGRPLTCTGSNLAYRREAYRQISGFDGIAHWISGDDDLLLHKMQQTHIGKIQYATAPVTRAAVRPPNSWPEFQAQRTRYASKSLHYEPALAVSLGLTYLLNLLICVGWVIIIFTDWNFFISIAAVMLLKALGEWLYLRQAAKLFGENKFFAVFPVAALLHPFYVVYFATRGQFAKFHWRGESFAARKNITPAESMAA